MYNTPAAVISLLDLTTQYSSMPFHSSFYSQTSSAKRTLSNEKPRTGLQLQMERMDQEKKVMAL